ncbi:MAG: hypothetical protein IT439_03635 [Phycisphaerales bacterium]|nr:hypothetical protein [Phycisphaerales bacterium]
MRSVHRSALMVSVAAGLATSAAAETAMTDAEKMKMRDLIKIMWKMQWEDGNTDTLEGALNPMGQGGRQGPYEPIDRRPPFGRGPVRITEAYRHYLELMRTNKLCKKVGQKNGGYTAPKPGYKNDEVGIAGDLLATWCDPAADPVQRAKAKFWIGATLANEITHVFQAMPAPGLTAAEKDAEACDNERDSDCMTIMYLEQLLKRLTDAAGDPHASLAAIEAEGHAGKCIAKCLMELGVDTAAEISGLVTEIRALLAHYTDRKNNLFENQINQTKSWEELYYGRKYKSPLRAIVDARDLQSMRKITVTWGATSIMLMVPNDGKIPIAYFVTVDSNSRLVLIVITLNPLTGEICTHTWTDTNANGTPETLSASVVIPGALTARPVPHHEDVDVFHVPMPVLGQADTLLVHDTLRGSLHAVEIDPSVVPTGTVLTLLDNTAIANPDAGDPLAGGFWILDQIHEFFGSGRVQFVFSPENLLAAQGDTPALVGEYESLTGTHTFLPIMTLAQARSPLNQSGISEIPVNPTGHHVMGNPGDTITVSSIGQGGIVPVEIVAMGLTGGQPAPTFSRPPGPDIFLVQSTISGAQHQVTMPSHGITSDPFEAFLNIDPFFDIFLYSGYPGRLALFLGQPSGAFQCAGEVVLEWEHGGIGGQDPLGNFYYDYGGGEVPLTPIPDLNLFGQTPIDCDNDGDADDFAIIARQCNQPGFNLLAVVNPNDPGMQVIPSFNFPPTMILAGISYGDFDDNGLTDMQVGVVDAPPFCLLQMPGSVFVPGPCPPECPADISGSADPNDPAYGIPDGQVDASDFFYFLDQFTGGNFAVADLTGSADPNNPAYGVPDGIIDASDFFFYLDLFVQGCF